MKTPICLCNGVIRSGSTWSFNVCRGLFQELAIQLKQPFGSSYLEMHDLERFVAGQAQVIPGPTVIKAHMIGPVALVATRSGRAKAVCTFRDPRDCVASDLIFMNQGLEFSVRRVASSLEFLRHYQTTPHMLLVQYEEMMKDPAAQIRRIMAHLGMPGDEAMVSRVHSKTNLEASKMLCGNLQKRRADQVLNIQSHRVDPETHLHENHIGNARTGRWKDELSVDQARWLSEYFAPWLMQLGYETRESLHKLVAKPAPAAPPAYVPAAVPMGSFSVAAGLAR